MLILVLDGADLRDMLRFAEDECRRRKLFRLKLSTSELQEANALVLQELRVSSDGRRVGSDREQ